MLRETVRVRWSLAAVVAAGAFLGSVSVDSGRVGIASLANAGITTWIQNHGQWWDWTVLDCRADFGTGDNALFGKNGEAKRKELWDCVKRNADSAVKEGWDGAVKAMGEWSSEVGKKFDGWLQTVIGDKIGCKISLGSLNTDINCIQGKISGKWNEAVAAMKGWTSDAAKFFDGYIYDIVGKKIGCTQDESRVGNLAGLGACITRAAKKQLDDGVAVAKSSFNWVSSIRLFDCKLDAGLGQCIWDKAAAEGKKALDNAKKSWDDMGKWAQKAFDDAKKFLDEKIRGLVDGALKTLATWVDDNVLNPALGMIEGAANKAIDWLVDQAVNRIVGSKIMARLDALMQQGAQQLKPFLDFLDKLEKGDMVDAALDVLMDWVRDAGFGVAWDHAGGLVKKALEMLTGTLKTGGQALVTSLGSVPGAGGLLAGAATWVLDEVMKWLTSEATSKIGTAIKTFFTDTLKNARNEIKAALASGPNEVKGAALPSSVAKGMKQVAGAVNTLISKINGVFKKMMELVKSRVNLTKYRNMAQKLVAK